MLGKLLKYDFKSTALYFGIVYGILVVYTIILKLFGFSGIGGDSGELLTLFGWLAYFLLLAGAGVFSLVMVLRRFHQNTFGAEGYLTHTLPVEAWQILLSKVLMGVIWTALTVGVIYGSACFLMLNVGSSIMQVISQGVLFLMGQLSTSTKVLYVLSMIVSPFQTIILLYTACCLGQLFQKRRVLASVLVYLGMSFVISTFNQIMNGVILQIGNNSDTALAVYSLISSVILSVAGYFLSHFIMKRLLNLE